MDIGNEQNPRYAVLMKCKLTGVVGLAYNGKTANDIFCTDLEWMQSHVAYLNDTFKKYEYILITEASFIPEFDYDD